MVNGTDTYYYRFNLQGDVTGIFDSNGSLVAEYTYDAWGKLLSVGGSNTTIANLNPIRYRGYYYDTESGFYYLQTRYYDPEVCRWINADCILAGVGEEVRGYNQFVYCFNSPINMIDSTGMYPVYVIQTVKTTKSKVNNNSFITSITYSLYDSNDWLPFFTACTVTETYNYSVVEGVVIINNDDNPGLLTTNVVVRNALASEMKKQAKNISPFALEGRTTAGLSWEMFLHSLGNNLFTKGLLKESARESNMGTTNRNGIGYDSNAMFFENPFKYLIKRLLGRG